MLDRRPTRPRECFACITTDRSGDCRCHRTRYVKNGAVFRATGTENVNNFRVWK